MAETEQVGSSGGRLATQTYTEQHENEAGDGDPG